MIPDYAVELFRCRPQGVTSPVLGDPPTAEPVDLTDRVTLDELGSINRAMERDLLSFKTGDLTLTLRDHDGFVTDLFADFGPTDVWSLRIARSGETIFWGMVIGVGSISFDDLEQTCEMTVYGLTKLLDTVSAEGVRRDLGPFTVTTASGGGSTLTLNTTAGLLTGDVLHLTDHVNSEDVTVQRVTSGTVLQLEAALAHGYAAGLPVEVKTPYHRYKSIQALVELLATEAGIPVAEVKLSASQFDRAAPTPVNLQGLTLAADFRRGCYQLFGKWGVAIHAVDSYTQEDPDDAWTVQGLTDKGVYDWNPYYAQGFWPGGPVVGTDEPFALYEPVVGTTQETGLGSRFATYWGAADYYSSPNKRIWCIEIGTTPRRLSERTTTDGVTYTAPTFVSLPADDGAASAPETGLEYDPGRNIVFCSWRAIANSNRYFRYRDLSGAVWVDCKQADDDADTGYYGARYVKELDGVLALRQDGGSTGPAFEICLFRGATRVWKRPFPGCLVDQPVSGNPSFYPTRTIRSVNGVLYAALVSDGAVQLLWTSDQFQTFTMRKLVTATTNTTIMACRVKDTYRVACYRGSVARGFFIVAPFYAGVVEYADFEGNSCAQGHKNLAVLSNAIVWIDDELQLHFVARDLFEPADVIDLGDPYRVKELSQVLVWDQTLQYVRVSGNGFEAVAGDAGFSSQGIDLASPYLPNEAYAQAQADDMLDFYRIRRRYADTLMLDRGDIVFRPLMRVLLGGARFLVYESDHAVSDDEFAVALLEDV